MIPVCAIPTILHGTSDLGAMLAATGIFGRNFCFRRQLTVREARMTRASDLFFWFGAAIVLGSGAALHVIEQVTTSLPGPILWGRAAIFGAAMALDVWPARRFRSWSRHLDLDQVPYFTDKEYFAIRRIWRLQVLLLALYPFFAPLAAACPRLRT